MNREEILSLYDKKEFELKQFLSAVKVFFSEHPELHAGHLPVIHSIKSRFKDRDHLVTKVFRKNGEGRDINRDNFFTQITDLIGVRILHLYTDQLEIIHYAIIDKIKSGDWAFAEKPKALSWDPETSKFCASLGMDCEIRDTYYTSIHYLVKPREDNPLCCEIQVRTLFDEIWGEIDHTINYPNKTESRACTEQLRVLAKLASTGTRLADSIFRSHKEYSDRFKSTPQV